MLVCVAATFLTAVAAAPVPDQPACGRSSEFTGGCPTTTAEIEDDAAKLETWLNGSGHDRSGHRNPDNGSGHGSDNDATNRDGHSRSDNGNGARNGAGTAGNSNSNSAGTGSTNTATTTEPACPPREIRCLLQRDDYDVIMVTLSDIERFRPSPGIQRMEPDGWTIAGLPTNIYSIAHRHIVRGELLDQPAEVRFTPVRWHWNYGDGTTATRATPGNTWAALRLGEFEATPTSHVYARSGNYTIRLNIEYRAEYRVGGSGFIPIAGTITLPANPLHITASGATTVLVDRDCTVAPRGPGC